MEDNQNDINKNKRCFIVTVGTSMLSKDHIFLGRSIQNQAPIDPEYLEKCEQDQYEPSVRMTNRDLVTVRQIKNYISYGKAKPEYGAELTALFGRDPKPQKCDCVTLIGTRTNEGDFCCQVLKAIFDNLCISCSIIQPKYLGLAEDKTFVEKGLLEFLNRCYDEIMQWKNKDYQVILCPNGGYKALIPYVTLSGLIEGLEIRYVYESSAAAMALPHLPIGPDMAAFEEHLLPLEDIQHETDGEKRKAAIGALPENLQSLFNEENGFSDLGEFLWKAYRTTADLTPLGRATGNKSLLAHLNDDLRAKFRALAGLDHLIWKGDRVPEMVEHASRHHTNLFRIAQRIILPCYRCFGDQFLNDEELFTLLCGLMVHDCGHVVGSVDWPAWKTDDKERLFPGEIREFHHILGYMRLEGGCKSSPIDPIYNELQELDAYKGIDAQKIWESYLKAPATAGLYHRKIMPLKKGEANFSDCGFYNNSGKGIGPLENVQVEVAGKNIDPQKMLLIVALLRLIDSLDMQSSRAGGISYVNFHMSALGSEISALSLRIKDLKESNILTPAELLVIETAANDSNVYDNTLKDRIRLDEITKTKPPQVAYLNRYYFELLLMKRFKELQKKHYAKHLPIDRIRIKNEYDSSIRQLRFFVEIVVNDSIYNLFDSQREAIDNFKKKCVEELKEEYSKIEKTLNKNNISVSF